MHKLRHPKKRKIITLLPTNNNTEQTAQEKLIEISIQTQDKLEDQSQQLLSCERQQQQLKRQNNRKLMKIPPQLQLIIKQQKKRNNKHNRYKQEQQQNSRIGSVDRRSSVNSNKGVLLLNRLQSNAVFVGFTQIEHHTVPTGEINKQTPVLVLQRRKRMATCPVPTQNNPSLNHPVSRWGLQRSKTQTIDMVDFLAAAPPAQSLRKTTSRSSDWKTRHKQLNNLKLLRQYNKTTMNSSINIEQLYV